MTCVLYIAIALLGGLTVLIHLGSEIKREIVYKKRMRNNRGEALKNAKEWIMLDQQETRDQLIRDWKDLKIGQFWSE